MRYRAQGKSALETRVDYVESKLDDTINNFKEAMLNSESRLDVAIKDFKESMQQMESRHKESIADIKEMVRDNKISLERIVAKTESSRRWSIGIVISIAVAVIGFLIAAIGFLLTNGFQVPT